VSAPTRFQRLRKGATVFPGAVGRVIVLGMGFAGAVFSGSGAFVDAFRHAVTTSAADFMRGSIDVLMVMRSARRSG
jgi:hypothetical protein